jgi:hypothetical protein
VRADLIGERDIVRRMLFIADPEPCLVPFLAKLTIIANRKITPKYSRYFPEIPLSTAASPETSPLASSRIATLSGVLISDLRSVIFFSLSQNRNGNLKT